MVQKNYSINQAVILCGGLGKRLGNITKKTPKPLIKINNKPFLNYLLDKLIKFNIQNVILLCAYKSEKFFKKYHNKNYKKKIKIICVKEKIPLGTGGALYNSKKKLDKIFYLLNGDSYFNFDLFQLKKNFLISKFDVILSAKKKLNTRYGELKIKKNILLSFGQPKKTKKSYINLGVYVFKKKVLQNFKNNQYISLENQILPSLVKKKKIQTLVFKNSFFIDIGVKNDLEKAKIKLPIIHKNN